MNTTKINLLTKRALKGDIKALKEVFTFLEKYNLPLTKYTMYSLLYQFVMNNLLELGKYCEECGGKCCKIGDPIPVYDFDYKVLKARLSKTSLTHLKRDNDIYFLPRPCPFQEGWACKIHEFKPYACLSYPFAIEDELNIVMQNYKDGVPDFVIPDFCLAGRKTKEFMDNIADNLRKKLGRDPTPRELLEEIIKENKS